MKSLLLLLCVVAIPAEAAPRQRARQAPAVSKKRVAPAPRAQARRSRPAPAPTVAAEPLVEEAPRPEPPEPIELKFSKSLNLDAQGLFYPYAVSSHTNDSLGIVKGELNTSLRVGRSILVKFRPTGTFDPANKSVSEQYYADVPEGYVQYRHSLGDSATSYTQLGWNTFTWGVTDGYNPVDVVNARRYADPLRSEKLGAFAITEKLDFDGFLMEGIFIPKQRRSLLPGAGSRWIPRDIPRELTQDGATYLIPANHSFYFRDDLIYDDALENNFGLRMGLKALGIDMGAYYFHGASAVPATQLRITGTVVSILPTQIIDGNPEIGLRPIYYKNNVYGGSMVFPLSDFLFRVEAAYTKPTRTAPKLPVSSFESVFEIEHTIAGEKQSVTLIGLLTYADHQDPQGSQSSTSLTRMFSRGVALGARYQPMESLLAELFAVLDTKYGGQLFKLESVKTLNDQWKVYAGGEIFAGKNTTPIGVYRKNDRMWAGLRLAF